MSTPLRYNSKMIAWKINAWMLKGIIEIGDIIDEYGDLLFTISDLKTN